MIELKSFDEYKDLEMPRRIMRYMLIWCSCGDAVIVVDDKELKLSQNQVLTITSGQIHYFKNRNAAKGYILEFTLDFFCKDDKDIELIFHNGLFCHFDLNEVILVHNPAAMETQLRLVREELRRQPYQYLVSVHARIELLLVEINRTKVNRGDEIYKPDALFLKFLEMVRADFEHSHPVSHYAGKLGTTERVLNAQAKLHAGKTAQNVISGLIISEAKRLLTYENATIKQVAYKLGFNDPFYFSNFFKKHALESPKSYQNRNAL